VLILSTVIVIALAAFAGYYFGVHRTPAARDHVPAPRQETKPVSAASPVVLAAVSHEGELADERERIGEEKARIIRSLERETATLRSRRTPTDAVPSGDAALSGELAVARAETARYRQLVVDIEKNAPPPILQGAAEPDDLKLIVGIGPVLERMLRNLGIHNFRQIARWSAHDVAEFDARLPEFPGRIVRDQWVTQARALYESKYGESALGKGS
jgi:predicted flap endonuclease-1-like 5' DNA nuclease